MVRVLGVLLAIGVAVWATGACGGGSKPPMQPDNDTTSLGDGGAAPEMTPPAAPAPAPSK